MSAPKPPLPPFTGSLTVADISKMAPATVSGMGKQAIKDIGSRYRQIVGLKPGSTSIRTPEMIEEILERLLMGASLAAITCLEHMPAVTTLYYWQRDDPKLDADIKWAQAMGQRTLKDLQMDIAANGDFSTGDVRRDEMLIRVIEKNASQRNRAEFGERVQVDSGRVNVTLPTWAEAISVKVIDTPAEPETDD